MSLFTSTVDHHHFIGVPNSPAFPRSSKTKTFAARMNSSTQQRLTSLRDLPHQYKGVLLDQFGVLHDGIKAQPGAIEAVQYLAMEREMKILIISNSSRRSAGALANLERMGFPIEAFAGGVITSGEVTHDALLHRHTEFWKDRRCCLHFTWGARGAISLDGLGVEVTQDPLKADFILAHGTEALGNGVSGADADSISLDQMKDLLRRCAERNLPMVVANPDIVTVHGSELRTMPGTLAKWYADMNGSGDIHLMGKPAPVIYQGALHLLGLAADQVIAIGDSLEHDIVGATTAGVDALFVGGGIHAVELGVGPPPSPPSNLQQKGGGVRKEQLVVESLCAAFEAHPRYYTDYFSI